MTETRVPDTDPFAEALFVASSLSCDLRHRLLRPAREADPGRIAFSEAAQCMADPGSPVGRQVLEAARRRPEIGSALAMLAQRFALADMPAVAAASDGTYAIRQAGDFLMRVEQSLQIGGPAYLVIQRAVEGTMPRLVVGIPEAGSPVMHVLPESEDGTIQLLLEAEAALLQLLRDPDCRFLLA